MLAEVTLFVLLLVLLYIWNQDPPGMPPGPRCYPVIGSFVATGPKQHKKLQDQYGDIVRVRVGQQYFVYLYKYKTIREVFSKLEFSGRPKWEAMNYMSEGKEVGVIFSSGEQWQHARRFYLRHLKDMGMGKSSMDDAILLEAKDLVEDFHTYADRPTRIPKSINVAVVNVIWQLVASRRYGLNDQKLISFLSNIRTFQEGLRIMLLPEFFPWLKYLPSPIYNRIFGFHTLNKNAEVATGMMKEALKQHRETLDASNPRDVIDAYLVEIEAHKDDPDSLFCETDLIRSIFDMFAAGFDTTSNMLNCILLCMAAHPDVQTRVQEEIDDVVNRDTLPCHLHRPRLVYLDAMIHEVHRFVSLVPFGVAHTPHTDVQIEGYNIPKGTMVIGCACIIHNDDQLWDQPEKFLPDRFLDEDGKLSAKRETFLPFGVGKRSCLGEALARMELYLFTAALFQNFTFSPPEGCQVDLGAKEVGGLQLFKEQNIIITPRK